MLTNSLNPYLSAFKERKGKRKKGKERKRGKERYKNERVRER